LSGCGTIGHVHGAECGHGATAPIPWNVLPRSVAKEDAEILERCRAALMHRAGIHTHSADVPEMTTREARVPAGVQPIELGTVVVLLEDPTPARRGRLTTAIGAAIGLPSPKMERDAVPGHLSYNLGVSTNADIAVVVSAWARIAALDGVSYVRIEGLSPQGLWVVENRPEVQADQEAWRFVLSGPEDVS
jgi:hypothetical protein